MQHLVYNFFAAAYDCGAYGSGDFGEGASCSTSGGGLAYTGEPWVLMVAGATALVVLAVSVLLWRRKKLAAQQ